MRRSTAASLCLIWGAALGGCSSGTQTVALRVSSEDAAGERSPLAKAHVRLVRLSSSPVPLPVSKETLADMGAQPSLCGWTDDEGVVRIEVRRKSAHSVEVQWPMWSDRSDLHGFRGVLWPDGRTLGVSGGVDAPGRDDGVAMVVDVVP